jgi:GNAT superfamily N-acetyltransferase
MDLRIVPATAETWPAVCRVMETPGDPEECWCQAFRHAGPEFEQRSVEANRADLEAQVRSSRAPGLVAWDADDPVGWCSVAPVTDLVRVTAGPMAEARPEGDDLDGRWALACFVVREEARGRGLLPALLAAGVEHARAQGARSVEGYPLDPERATEVTADDLFAGTLRQWEAQGFAAVAPLGPRRRLVVRRLG